MQKPFNEMLEEVVAQDPRYPQEAYVFLREALEFTQKRRRKGKAGGTSHVTPGELLEGYREYTLKQFGPMAMTVLEYWGVRSCRDVGDMVFNLIDAGIFGRSPDDRPEDFDGGFTFEEAFVAPFRISPPVPRHRADSAVLEKAE